MKFAIQGIVKRVFSGSKTHTNLRMMHRIIFDLVIIWLENLVHDFRINNKRTLTGLEGVLQGDKVTRGVRNRRHTQSLSSRRRSICSCER
jgi:hypothetical protein